MKTAIYPGSFDPVHNGHLDVIERTSRICDKLIIAVAYNDAKSALFTNDERVQLIRETTAHLGHVEVVWFEGLLADFFRECGAEAVIRGLRAVSDFEYEFQMALMNRSLEDSLETIFMMPGQEYIFLSSRIVKEVAQLGGDIDAYVPPPVKAALMEKVGK